MRVYRFHLPTHTNKGASYDVEFKSWLEDALAIAGGYTVLGPAQGAWKSPEGRVYVETVVAVEVAAEDEFGEGIRRDLVGSAKLRFPDQEAIYSAEVGQAWIE